MSLRFQKTIDTLVLEKGELKGRHYHATITAKEVLERSGQEVTPQYLNYISYLVKIKYPESSIIGKNPHDGAILQMKIWSKKL